MGMLCCYHEGWTDTNKCSQAYVKSWCFTILCFTNYFYSIPIAEGKHYPIGLGFEDEVNDDDWEVKEERKFSGSASVRSFGHGEFASSDIRYRNNLASNTSKSVNVSNLSDMMANTSARSSLPTSSRSSVMSESCRPPEAGAGRGLLLQSLKSQRSSRMAANLN